MWIEAFTLQIESCTQDSTSLHLSDARISVTQTATTVTQHWVVFAEAFNTLLDIFNSYAHSLSHFFLTLQIVWYEFVERWVKQTYVYWMTVHSTEDTLEVFLLDRKQLSQCLLTTFYISRQDHLTHSYNLILIEEHMFCTAKTDTTCTEATSYLSIVWSISVSTNQQLAILSAEIHQSSEVT